MLKSTFLIAPLLAFTLGGCRSLKKEQGLRNKIGVPYTFTKNPDPFNIYYSGDWISCFHNWSTLINLKEDGSFEPSIAQSWSISSDGKTYYFRLRPNLRWSDNTKITAEDVVQSLNASTKGTSHSDLSRAIEKIEIEPEDSISIKLSRPIPALLIYLTYVDWSIIHPNTIETDPKTKTYKIVSTKPASGPYVVTNDRSSLTVDEVELRMNPFSYIKPEMSSVKLLSYRNCSEMSRDAMELVAFRAYRDDWNENCQNQLEAAGLVISEGAATFALNADFTESAKKNFSAQTRLRVLIEIRKLLKSFARPKGYYISNGLRPLASIGTLTTMEFDQIVAEIESSLLSEKDVLPKKIRVVAQDSWSNWTGYTWLVDQLRKLGIETDYVILSKDEFWSAVSDDSINKNFDIIASPLGVADPDPDASWRIARKYSYSDIISSAELTNALFETDQTKRMEMYKGLEKKLLKSGAYIPLFFTSHIIGIHKDYKTKNLASIFHGIAAFDLVKK